jgi:hypothetical protein
MMFGIALDKINELQQAINQEVKQPENMVEWLAPKTGLIIDRKGYLWEIVKVSGKKNIVAYVKPHLMPKGKDQSVRRVNREFRGSVWYYIKREYALLAVLKHRYDKALQSVKSYQS